MKVATAVNKIWECINNNQYAEADRLLHKYRLLYGNRKFNYWLRLHISNGLWLTNNE